MPGPILEQAALFGHAEPIGFGDDSFRVELIGYTAAAAIIEANHYSGTSVSYATENFGVFIGGQRVGALQWGYAMNPASGPRVVSGSTLHGWRELNRMWLDDAAPRNSESRAISYCLKWFRIARRDVEWVQSFADERCGGLGVVYQACSFLYVGEHTAVFWELDGKMYHNVGATCKDEARLSSRPGWRYLQDNLDRATPHKLRQFRYFRALTRRARRNLLLEPQPYPKPEAPSA